jgi:hypothetical protein
LLFILEVNFIVQCQREPFEILEIMYIERC